MASSAIVVVLGGCGNDSENTSSASAGAANKEGAKRANASDRQASAKAVAPGVPVSKHGDNSIQTWGLEASPAKRGRVRDFVQEYLDARAAKKWDSACDFLAAKQRREHERIGRGADCGKVMALFASRKSSRSLAEAAEIDVFSLRVGGRYAFLIYRQADRKFYATALTREGGRWRIVTVTPNPIY